jgi:diguanylate cyclase (GGDEF)-like protein
VTEPEILEYMSRVPLFRELQAEGLERITRRVLHRRVDPDTDIVHIGDPGRALYVIVEGEVDVVYPARSTEFKLARLGPGECFGEMAILNDMPSSATVRSTGPVGLLVLQREDFAEAVRESPRIATVLLEALSVRVRNAYDQLGEMNEQAMRDELTGLLNRRAFHERLGEESDRNRRYGDPFSLVLVDLDRFKTINESLGHNAGDRVLAWVGRILVEHTRSVDSVYRIGGEEFAIICPASEGPFARQAAERLVSVVAQAAPPLAADLQLTMSAGYAACPAEGRSPEQVFQAADRALTRAKADGRNRVCDPPSRF